MSRRLRLHVQRVLTIALLLGLTVAQVPSTAFAQGAGPDAGDGLINDSLLEFGVWWVEDYPPAGPGGSDLPATRPDALGLRDMLTSTCKFSLFGACFSNWSTGPWISRFVYGNTNAWSTDWRRSQNGGSENFYIDSIDLAYFAGHGSANGIIFGVGSPTPVTVTKNDALNAWGDRDLAWIGFAACNLLDNPISNLQGWGEAMNGVRLIMGFQTVMNDVPHGVEFGRYIRDNYTMTQAWFKAADKLQSQGRVARVLAEQQAYFNDKQGNHNSATVVNWPKYFLTHSVGSEPARPVSVAQIGNEMPVLPVQPIPLAERAGYVSAIGNSFGISITLETDDPEAQAAFWNAIEQEGDGVVYSEDGQLEVDSQYGLFLHADKDNLWVIDEDPQVAEGMAMLAIDQNTARQLATNFLSSNNLLPNDAQFYEVKGTGLTQLNDPLRVAETGEAAEVHLRDVSYQVIFSRMISIPISSGIFSAASGDAQQEAVEFSVMGPGSKLKVYVPTEVAVPEGLGIASILEDPESYIYGGMGGYRDILTTEAQMAATGAVQTVQVMPLEKIEKLFNNPSLEAIVSLDHVPVAPTELISREIVSETLAYWEGPIGFNQGELIPVWALTVNNLMEGAGDEADYNVESTSYIPVDPTYMAPLAYIQSSVAISVPVAPGTTIRFDALDASMTLAQLGLDPSPNDGFPLDFALGTGDEDSYLYNWYLNEVSEENSLTPLQGSGGRSVEFTVPLLGDFKEGTLIGNHRIILEVVDSLKGSEPNTSRAEVAIQVRTPTYIPSLSAD